MDLESDARVPKLDARSGTILRPYQLRAIAGLREHVRGGAKAVLLVLPTGGGKTAIATAVVRQHLAKDRAHRVLFLAHRTELIKQAAGRLRAEGVTDMRVVQGGGAVGDSDARVTVASIPTLITPRWLAALPAATLVIFDEAHHTRAVSWSKIADAYAASIRIGLTATPERADGQALGDIFEQIVVVSTVRELTDLGYLVPCSVFAPASYTSALAADPVDAYMDHGEGKRAIVFCPTVAHAQEVATRLTEQGVPAACVDGGTAAGVRSTHLQRFAAGELRVVTNCGVLTEGFDDPGAEVVILARACDHVGMFLQIVGRVLRPAPGKQSCKLIDLRGAVHRHGLPDDDRSYSLEGEAISSASRLPPLKQCKRCGYCGRTWKQCPSCEYRQADPEPPEVRRERLQQIVAAEGAEQRRGYLDRLLSIAKERGYAAGWVAHRFRAKYGVWPVGVQGVA
jgi:superfamily II DNA or RNA helicase